jgi:uncharacterized protein YjiS (DUF1127 family)
MEPFLVHELRAGTRRILGRLRACVARLRIARRRAAGIRALQLLDDRMLRDIGFHRAEIASVVSEMLGEAPPTRLVSRRANVPSEAGALPRWFTARLAALAALLARRACQRSREAEVATLSAQQKRQRASPEADPLF